jgi:predicted Rossmann fold nucleotide-binding protein DprA/Smf involved in DNA uptake
MTQLQDQLKNVSKTLTSLSRQLESISKKIAKVPAAKSPAKQKAVSKAKAKTKTKAKAATKKRVASKPAASKAIAAKGKTVLESVYDVIRRSRNGASIAKLKDKTGLEARQLSNALYKLSRRGRIEARSRGVYIKAKG